MKQQFSSQRLPSTSEPATLKTNLPENLLNRQNLDQKAVVQAVVCPKNMPY
jgi:hypothetical protein